MPWAARCVPVFEVDEEAEARHAAWKGGGGRPDGVVPKGMRLPSGRAACRDVLRLGGGTRLRDLHGGGMGSSHPIGGGKNDLESKKYSSRVTVACAEF